MKSPCRRHSRDAARVNAATAKHQITVRARPEINSERTAHCAKRATASRAGTALRARAGGARRAGHSALTAGAPRARRAIAMSIPRIPTSAGMPGPTNRSPAPASSPQADPRSTREAGQMPPRGKPSSPPAGAQVHEPPAQDDPLESRVHEFARSQGMHIIREGQKQMDKAKAARDEHTAEMEEDDEPL
jgi:hypothetical protein